MPANPPTLDARNLQISSGQMFRCKVGRCTEEAADVVNAPDSYFSNLRVADADAIAGQTADVVCALDRGIREIDVVEHYRLAPMTVA